MSDATANSTTVYKQVSDDMRQGLRRIYQEIVSASGDGKNPNGTGHDELFTEASVQLNEIMEATEKATMRIMELVEAQLDCQMESAQLLSSIKSGQPCSAQLARLTYINNKLGEDLTEIITALSFQDLTGQRIKKVVKGRHEIEAYVVDMYLSSGLVMDGAEKDPTRSMDSLRSEASKAMEAFRESRTKVAEVLSDDSNLKGPSKESISQSAIDDMLAQLGM